MSPTAILWPMIGHAVLVGIVYGVLRVRRYGAVRSGEAKVSQFRERGSEPSSSAAVSGNLMNQFELPMLLHAVCLALYVTNGVSYISVTLAWLFIVLRYVHAAVALTGNRIRYRSPAFAAGAVVMGLLWLYFALHLAGAV